MLLDRFRGKKLFSEISDFQRLLMILSMFCVFLTPLGLGIIEAPFKNGPLQSYYNSELIPFSLEDFFSLKLLSSDEFPLSIQKCLVILSIILLIVKIKISRIRISHTLIFLGGLVLLLKHNRFIYEYLLLSLPIYKFGLSRIFSQTNLRGQYLQSPIFMSILACVFFGLLSIFFINPPDYPFSRTRSPQGICNFLNHVNTGGRVFNNPNMGGYYQWALNSNYKIYADLELILFNDYDIFLGLSAFSSKKVFSSVISKYDPSYLSVPINNSKKGEIVTESQIYIPVFFDESAVLYVNRNHYPEIAKKYQLVDLEDPFNYFGINYDKLDVDKTDRLFIEIKKIVDIDENNLPGLLIMGQILINKNNYDNALAVAEKLIKSYPETPYGYDLKGEILSRLKKFPEAIDFYNIAMNKSSSSTIPTNLYRCYREMGDHKKAYKILSEYVNPFKSSSYKDVYNLVIAAASAGDSRTARLLLPIALMQIPEEETSMLQTLLELKTTYDKNYKTENFY
ncbi:MAG: tetratricopeptide repeat protein [Deltaproteobacteria bacterium]|nr:tetratricopeptide repeat protein [Deltaproteobacteria bacterium]